MGKTGLLTLRSAVLLRKNKKFLLFWWLHMACHSFWWWCKKAERWQEILQQWKLVGSLPSYKKALWREKNTCGDCTLSNFPILFRNLYQASRLRLFFSMACIDHPWNWFDGDGGWWRYIQCTTYFCGDGLMAFFLSNLGIFLQDEIHVYMYNYPVYNEQ